MAKETEGTKETEVTKATRKAVAYVPLMAERSGVSDGKCAEDRASAWRVS